MLSRLLIAAKELARNHLYQQKRIFNKLLNELIKVVDVSLDIPEKGICRRFSCRTLPFGGKENEFHGLHQETK
jgi:hypothetical protein